jgi:hypothetical protein
VSVRIMTAVWTVNLPDSEQIVLLALHSAAACISDAAQLPNLDSNHGQVGSDETGHSDVHRHDTSPFAGMGAGDRQVVDALKVYAR